MKKTIYPEEEEEKQYFVLLLMHTPALLEDYYLVRTSNNARMRNKKKGGGLCCLVCVYKTNRKNSRMQVLQERIRTVQVVSPLFPFLDYYYRRILF